MLIHSIFDLIAALSALAMTAFVYRWRLAGAGLLVEQAGAGYALSLVTGAVLGGYGAGSLNLWLSGVPAVGRSVVGALAGAILAVEIFKRAKGIRGSTGLIFVPAFATSIMIGRWGCFLAGIEDHTYGTVTTLPWGHDFGDGLLRHPVQLYESFALAGFLAFALTMIGKRDSYFAAKGFYLLVTFYASQRLIWEFLKPYGTVLGPFNLFHLVCVAMICYGLVMIRGERR